VGVKELATPAGFARRTRRPLAYKNTSQYLLSPNPPSGEEVPPFGGRQSLNIYNFQT